MNKKRHKSAPHEGLAPHILTSPLCSKITQIDKSVQILIADTHSPVDIKLEIPAKLRDDIIKDEIKTELVKSITGEIKTSLAGELVNI